MTISVYSFEDKDGNAVGCYTTQSFREAREYAAKYKLRIIDNIYEWSEAVPVAEGDYTQVDDEEEEEATE